LTAAVSPLNPPVTGLTPLVSSVPGTRLDRELTSRPVGIVDGHRNGRVLQAVQRFADQEYARPASVPVPYLDLAPMDDQATDHTGVPRPHEHRPSV